MSVFEHRLLTAKDVGLLGDYFLLNGFLQESWARNVHNVSFLDSEETWIFLRERAKKAYYKLTNVTCAKETIDPLDFDTGDVRKYTYEHVPEFIQEAAAKALKNIYGICDDISAMEKRRKKRKDRGSKPAVVVPDTPPSAPDWAFEWAAEA